MQLKVTVSDVSICVMVIPLDIWIFASFDISLCVMLESSLAMLYHTVAKWQFLESGILAL